MTTHRYRSVFISDVHLGTRDCRADFLLDFLCSIRCRSLYLVGDIIDFESLAQRPYWPDSHAAVLGKLLRMAADGVRVVYIPGNHDAALRGLVGQRIGGIEVMLKAEHIGADGRRFLVSHGDEFDPHHGGKRWLYRLGDASQRFICWANRALNRWRRRLHRPYLPLSIIIKSRVARALAYIQHFEAMVAREAMVAGYDGHICGHIHFGGIRRIDGVLYCNDGDWVEHCTALTEDEQGWLRLIHWSEQQACVAEAKGDRVMPEAVAAMAFASLASIELPR
jgi:UDP-2,3-diacylglucosamine pyrophosphatase LpxH